MPDIANRCTEDDVRRRAYEIWESEERPQGEDVRHWMQAFDEMNAPDMGNHLLAEQPDAEEIKSSDPGNSQTVLDLGNPGAADKEQRRSR